MNWKAELRQAELPAANEAFRAIFRPTPGSSGRTFYTSTFSAARKLTFCIRCTLRREREILIKKKFNCEDA